MLLSDVRSGILSLVDLTAKKLADVGASRSNAKNRLLFARFVHEMRRHSRLLC